MSGTNTIPPIPLRFDGAEGVQNTIDALIRRIGQLETAGKGASGGMAVLKTQADQVGGAFRNTGQIIGQAGYQVQDFAVQVASGQSALTAFVQQGSQLAGIFGTGGIIAGAALAVGGIVTQILLGRDATKAWNDALKEQEASLRRVTTEADRWREGLSQEATQVRQLTDYYSTLSEARRAVEVREVLRQQTTLNEREASLRRTLEGNAGSLASGVQDQLTQARDYARAMYPSGSAEQAAALDALDNSDATRRLQDLVDTYERFRNSGRLTVDIVAEMSASLRVLGQENDSVGRLARRAADEMERQLPAIRELEGAQRDLTVRSQALGVATSSLATGVDTARASFERLRDVILANPFRGLDAQIAAASERMGALSRGGIALYEGVQSIQGEQERASALYRTWETGRRAELTGPGGMTAAQAEARIREESADALMRSLQAANQGRVETYRVSQAREAARGGGGSRLPDPELQAGWLAVQDQNRDREAADRQEARDWDQEQERREREAERAQERAIEANRRTTDSIVNYTADAFADMFDENGKGWEGMLDTFESTFKRLIARIAAEAIIRPIVEPVVSSLGLGSLGSGGGGLSGLFGGSVSSATTGGVSGLSGATSLSRGGVGGLLGSVGGLLSTPIWTSGGGWFGSASVAAPSIANMSIDDALASLPATPTSATTGAGGITVGSYLASAGAGYAGGSMLGNYLAGSSKARQLNSQIGAGAGAMVGAVFGPVGAIAGGLIGGAAGGLIGPGKGFSGGDVGVAVDANGYLTLGNVGGKNWNGGDARNQTSAGLESINAMLRASGVTITGMGTGTLGYQGYGGSKNTFGPTEIWNRVSGGLTTSNSTLAAALGQGWMQSFEDLSVIAPYAAQNDNLTRALGSGAIRSRDDFNTASQWITSIYEPMVKAAQVGNQWEEALRQQNASYDAVIAKARELGQAETDLVAARAKAEAETYRQRDTAVHNALASLGIDEFTAAGNTRAAAIASFNLESGNRLTSLQEFLIGNGLGEGTREYASATSRLNALIEQQRTSMLQGFATTLTDAMASLRIGELQAGTPAQQRQAQLLQFDLSAEQQRTGLLGTLRNAGFADDSSRSTDLINRLNALLETQRKTLAEQLAANDNRANSGTGLLQELLFGESSGMSAAARFAGGVGSLANIKRTGNLDDYVSTAQRFLPIAQSYLGTSERYASLTAGIRKDIVGLGGDPTGLMQSIDYQSRTATGVEMMVSRLNVSIDETKALRNEMNKLGATLTALVRRYQTAA